jgi:hypothetical protein
VASWREPAGGAVLHARAGRREARDHGVPGRGIARAEGRWFVAMPGAQAPGTERTAPPTSARRTLAAECMGGGRDADATGRDGSANHKLSMRSPAATVVVCWALRIRPKVLLERAAGRNGSAKAGRGVRWKPPV